MRALCDLHTHSNFSDGTDSPEQLLAAAQKMGLKAIVLCDHNSVKGLPEFMEASARYTVEAVPGIEFSTEYQGVELHILGLYIRPVHYPQITAMMEGIMERKERSERELVEALCRNGMDLSYDAIKGKTRGGYVNRAHIAAELVERGYASSFDEAFHVFLSPRRGFYVPPKRLDAFDVIRFIKSIGGAAVLAHPFLSMDEQLLRQFLPEAKCCGLDAMETLYTKYDGDTTQKAIAIAAEYGILQSGGSDYHGTNKPDTRLGCGRGDLQVPIEFLEQLRLRTDMTE